MGLEVARSRAPQSASSAKEGSSSPRCRRTSETPNPRTSRSAQKAAGKLCARRPVFRLPSLGLHKRDRDGVQELERARLNGRTVALSVLVIAGNPVSPCLGRARHLVHILDSHTARLANHISPPGHIVHVFKLLCVPGCEQTCRQRVMAGLDAAFSEALCD